MIPLAASSGNFLVSPSLGLMIWTLIAFGITMAVLRKLAFPRIGEALEKRATAIRDNIEAAERQRAEADELLKEYRERLAEAREQADDIVTRARKASEAAVAEATALALILGEEDAAALVVYDEFGIYGHPDHLQVHRAGMLAAARADIEMETRRSLEKIRNEVADLTVLATEKVTRKSLDSADHQKLIEEALSEVDFTALAGAENGGGE